MNRVHIAVIDDNPSDNRWFTITLQEAGYECDCTVYDSGVSALAGLRAGRETNLIVVDWYMPSFEPMELLDAIRAIPGVERTPIAVFAPKHECLNLQRNWWGGKLFLVTKPVDQEQLSLLIEGMESKAAGQQQRIFQPRKFQKLYLGIRDWHIHDLLLDLFRDACSDLDVLVDR